MGRAYENVSFYVGLHQPSDGKHFARACISITAWRGRTRLASRAAGQTTGGRRRHSWAGSIRQCQLRRRANSNCWRQHDRGPLEIQASQARQQEQDHQGLCRFQGKSREEEGGKMTSIEDAMIDWDEESVWGRRAAIRAQDARFCRAVTRAHPELLPPPPPKPKRLRATPKSPRHLSTNSSPNWKRIVGEVALSHDVEVSDLVGPGRSRKFVAARQEAMFRLSKETAMSLPAIGRKLGRDHTTVLYGIRCCEERMRSGG